MFSFFGEFLFPTSFLVALAMPQSEKTMDNTKNPEMVRSLLGFIEPPRRRGFGQADIGRYGIQPGYPLCH